MKEFTKKINLTELRINLLKKLSWQELKSRGYRMTSRKYGCISRIDSPDWKLKTKNEDQYRRVYSKDTFDVGFYKANKCGTSCHTETGYINVFEGEHECSKKQANG